MSLKDKQSRFDLVNGENPVSNMANQQGDPLFNTQRGTLNSPFESADHMVHLLNQTVKSSNTGQVYQPAPNSSDYQDLDGVTPSKYTDNLPT